MKKQYRKLNNATALKKSKIKIVKGKTLKKQLDELWAKIIKLKAGNKSELSGKTENLHSHHILGKSSYRLRYELDNGICLTAGEHFFGVHHQGRQKEYEAKIRAVKGQDIYERLEILKNEKSKSLVFVKLYLEREYKKLQILYVFNLKFKE